MNERMKELADFIEARRVSMRRLNDSPMVEHAILVASDNMAELSCGTAGCIAGWAIVKDPGAYRDFLSNPDYGPDSPWTNPAVAFVGYYYGLDRDQRKDLCCPRGYDLIDPVPSATQKKRALEVLRGQRPLDSNWLVT